MEIPTATRSNSTRHDRQAFAFHMRKVREKSVQKAFDQQRVQTQGQGMESFGRDMDSMRLGECGYKVQQPDKPTAGESSDRCGCR